MKTIIVDDEPKAIALLEGYLSHFKQFELAGTFRNGLKAFEFMSKHQVDLVFLDINMPHINGISLSKIFDRDTRVIFTTAYSEFAVESYEVNAVDYLLKPISLDRFTRAVTKVLKETPVANTHTDNSIVLVKSGSAVHRVDPGSILFIEKEGNYAVYHMDDRRITARESIADLLEKLPSCFCRVHKSFVINIQKVSSIDRDLLTVGDREIPVGAAFRDLVRERLLGQ